MPLIVSRPDPMPVDRSQHRLITFTSPADGMPQTANIYAPASAGRPLPLVLAPHPITWTAEQDFHEGYPGFTRGYHRGYYNLADQYNVVIAMQHGHHRRVENCSLASPEQITDMIHLIDELQEQGYEIDTRRVYACGLSMGGQEALVVAGQHPDKIAAAVAFNPIVDLAAWQEDLARTEVEAIREFGTDQRIADEVGGLPDEVPELYAERSATSFVDGLAQVPTLIYWTHEDLIVPRQITHHSYLLYEQVKETSITAPVAEYNHTQAHGLTHFDDLVRWQLHEWADYELAIGWLLIHRK